ncbi:MAG: hypothetical protein H7Y11_12355, partial [Armatimonadetes bacterium]|nr:hypothetical protein [Anaerolineae bacterium]
YLVIYGEYDPLREIVVPLITPLMGQPNPIQVAVTDNVIYELTTEQVQQAVIFARGRYAPSP